MKKKILVIAAHSDDEIIGCGGTITKHISEGNFVKIIFLADGVSSRIKSKSSDINLRHNVSIKALKKLGVTDIINLGFPDNQLDTIPLLVITKKLEEIINQYKPQIIYTHHFGDLNIDHEITHKAVLTACRPQPKFSVLEIYSFEIMSSTEWNTPGFNTFVPDTFIDITKYLNKKIAASSSPRRP